MFETLEEQIDKTEGETPSTRARAVRYAGVLVITALVVGALYAAIVFLE
jgi:hypothetical protein